jgi:surface protein
MVAMLSGGGNGDISNWDVSNVTNMSQMFRNNWGFNQDISSWDVSNVTNMESMFLIAGATAGRFNQDLSNWDVDGVVNCNNFSYGTFNSIWTLPKPNFTNCTPSDPN